MPQNKDQSQYIVRSGGQPASLTTRFEQFVKQVRDFEDLLLLFSLPGVIATLLLWDIGSLIGASVPFLGFIINLLVTLLILLAACVLLLQWIDMLQIQYSKLIEKTNERNTLNFLATGLVCLVLLSLALGTASEGGGDARTVLMIFVVMLLGWHYKVLLKRIPLIPHHKNLRSP